MSNAIRFSDGQNVPAKPPVNDITVIMDKAFTDEPLTRPEKNSITTCLYGLFGAQSSNYRFMGWMWQMWQAKQLRRILVSFKYEPETFHTYYAPDKTSLRNALEGPICEMVYA